MDILSTQKVFLYQCWGMMMKQFEIWGSRFFSASISPQTFSAQIVLSPIRCSLTVQLFRVWVRVSQKAPNWCQKGPCRSGCAEKSWTRNMGVSRVPTLRKNTSLNRLFDLPTLNLNASTYYE